MLRRSLIATGLIPFIFYMGSSACFFCDPSHQPDKDKYYSVGIYNWETKVSEEDRLKLISGKTFLCSYCYKNSDNFMISDKCDYSMIPDIALLLTITFCKYHELMYKSAMPFTYNSGVEFYHYPNLEHCLNFVREIAGYNVMKIIFPIIGKYMKRREGVNYAYNSIVYDSKYEAQVPVFGGPGKAYEGYAGFRGNKAKSILGFQVFSDYVSYNVRSFDDQDCFHLLSACMADRSCYSIVLGGDAYNVNF